MIYLDMFLLWTNLLGILFEPTYVKDKDSHFCFKNDWISRKIDIIYSIYL